MNRNYTRRDSLAARAFAARMHSGQQRKCGGAPYMLHIEGVVRHAGEAGLGELEITAAYLHDLLEKSEASYEDLTASFGTPAADLVAELSNDMEMLQQMGKKEYLTYKMRRMGPSAFTLKLCDILDNAAWALSRCTPQRKASALENYRYILENLPPERLTGVNAELARRIRAVLEGEREEARS